MAESIISVIVSCGANANGIWVRFKDGTQICFGSYEFTVYCNSVWGSLYETQSPVDFGDWAQPFVDIPRVSCLSTKDAVIVESLKEKSRTKIGTSYLARASSGLAYAGIDVIGIGRWK